MTDDSLENAQASPEQADEAVGMHAENRSNEGKGSAGSGRDVSERALRAAMEILARWEAERETNPLDRIVGGEFRSRRYLNSGERRWVSETVYGCARYWRRQTFLLEALNVEVNAANAVRLWADMPDAVLQGGITSTPILASRFQTPPVADAEAIGRALATLPGRAEAKAYLRITLAFPEELAANLEALLGPEAIEAAQAFNTQAPTTLRVNPLRVSWAHLRKSLPEGVPTRYSPWGLELPRRVNVFDLPGFRTGWFEVQEEASQLVALLVDAEPGQAIAEVGAGAGGKTLALAALLENQGRIFALDTNKIRLEELGKRAIRAGATCVEPCLISADGEGTWQPTVSARRTINKWIAQANAVLVDVPCTGSGVLRRMPDAKWRDFDHSKMVALQQNLLEQAAMLTAPGGHLFYVTCAFERSQNEDIVEAFLTTEFGQQFTVVPAIPRLIGVWERARHLAQLPSFLRSAKAQAKIAARREAEGTTEVAETDAVGLPNFTTMQSGNYLRTWPHRHGLDAFFAACLQRKE